MRRAAAGAHLRRRRSGGGTWQRRAAPHPALPLASLPLQINGSWHKPLISAKNAARLRKEALQQGKEWPFEKPAAEAVRRKPKGHKHDREKPLR